MTPTVTDPGHYRVVLENERVRSSSTPTSPGTRRTTTHPRHRGENTGDTPSHSIFVELEDGVPDARADGSLGPD